MAETIKSFAKRVKDKYPEYKDVTDESTTYDFVQKYPEYRKVFDAPIHLVQIWLTHYMEWT